MISKNRLGALAVLGVFLAGLPLGAIAQTGDKAQPTRTFEEWIAAQDNSAARARRLEDPAPNRRLPTRVRELSQAVRKFETAVAQFNSALSYGTVAKEAASEVSRQVDVFLRYLKWKGLKPDAPDTTVLLPLSIQDRGLEIIEAARRVYPYLRMALQTERADVVSIDFLTNLAQVEGDVVRLKWLATHLK